MNLSAQHKIFTIKKSTEIKEILSTGKKIRTKYGVFFLGKNATNNRMDFAVLIKKSTGKAVWRNYCKRIVKAYARKKIDMFPANRQIIFIYTYEGKIKYNLLEEEFNKNLRAL